jgi:hypothetical protein
MLAFKNFITTFEFSEAEKEGEFKIQGVALNIGAIPSHKILFKEEDVEKAINNEEVLKYFPVITDHQHSVWNIVGMVEKLAYDKENQKVLFSAKITHPQIQEQIKRGFIRYVSLGMDIQPYCSICGNPLNSPECKHIWGQKYGEETCYAVAKDIRLKELSLVLFPADRKNELSFEESVEDAIKQLVELSEEKAKNFEKAKEETNSDNIKVSNFVSSGTLVPVSETDVNIYKSDLAKSDTEVEIKMSKEDTKEEITLEEQVAALTIEELAEMHPDVASIIEQNKILAEQVEAFKKAEEERKVAEKKALAEKVYDARKEAGLSEKPVEELVKLPDEALKIMLEDAKSKIEEPQGKVKVPQKDPREEILMRLKQKFNPKKYEGQEPTPVHSKVYKTNIFGKTEIAEW